MLAKIRKIVGRCSKIKLIIRSAASDTIDHEILFK